MRKLQRRDFLKYSAAGASLVAFEHYLGGLSKAVTGQDRAYVNRNTGKRVKGVPTTCAGCNAGCGVIAYVHDGVLMKLKGNPAHPVNKGAMCIVGEAAFYSCTDPERIKKPLLRVGKRGQGNFKEVGWGEALSLMAGKLKAAKGRLVLETKGGASDPGSSEFASRLGGKMVSHGHTVSEGREKAMMAMFGAPLDIPDIKNTDYILNFGANPYYQDVFGVATSGAISKRTSENGAVKLVTFDPRLSETAGRSSEWIPLLPGTDAVVALAMANVIMKEGLYDSRFIEKATNASVTGLKAYLAPFTPSAAERITGVPAGTIWRVAAEYARAGRAVLITGSGVSSHAKGAASERAVRMLPVITGKLNRTGCNIIPEGARPAVSDMGADELYRGIMDGTGRPAVYIVHGCDPAYDAPDLDKLSAILADESGVGFIVSIDTHVTDTGMFADLVLPSTTYLEEYAVESGPGPDGEMLVRYRQPVIRQAGESRPYLDILSGVAREAGTKLSFISSYGYSEATAAAIKELPMPGGVARLEEAGFYSAAKRSGQGASVKGRIGTKSGKVEVMEAGGAGLPSMGGTDTFGNWKDGEYALVRYSPVGYRAGVTENNIMLKEMNHTNWAMINTEAGRSLGLRNRDMVTLSSPAGHIELPVMLSPGIQRNTVAVASGCGHRGYGNIEKGVRYRSSDPFTHVIWWGHEGSGVNPNRLVATEAGSKKDGLGWTIAKVSIQKA